jgi:hypothetical protein
VSPWNDEDTLRVAGFLGEWSRRTREVFFSAGRGLCREHGADAVLLGGTDLFLAFDGCDCGFPGRRLRGPSFQSDQASSQLNSEPHNATNLSLVLPTSIRPPSANGSGPSTTSLFK